MLLHALQVNLVGHLGIETREVQAERGGVRMQVGIAEVMAVFEEPVSVKDCPSTNSGRA